MDLQTEALKSLIESMNLDSKFLDCIVDKLSYRKLVELKDRIEDRRNAIYSEFLNELSDKYPNCGEAKYPVLDDSHFTIYFKGDGLIEIIMGEEDIIIRRSKDFKMFRLKVPFNDKMYERIAEDFEELGGKKNTEDILEIIRLYVEKLY